MSLVVAASVAIGLYFLIAAKQNKKTTYLTSEIKKDSLLYEITATGTLNDSLSVDVGTQVSGIISKIFVDFNDVVKKGQVIAMIDTVTLAATVVNAEANLYKAKTLLLQQEKEYNRYKELLANKAVPQSDYDQVEANYKAAVSELRSAEADLHKAKTNLSYATITAPISGVVITRNVNVGQTVAASFATPTLFTIGNDPHKMLLEAKIDEADIGWVKKGQQVKFTVETYPDKTFAGTVNQVRLQPIINQNVVTYNVEINVLNPDLLLMPGMTANLSVSVIKHTEVLTVPMAALFFNPEISDTNVISTDNNKQTVWIKCNKNDTSSTNEMRCVNIKGTYMQCDTVKKVLDNGSTAEIESPEIKAGMQVITGVKIETGKKTKSLIPTANAPRPRGAPGR